MKNGGRIPCVTAICETFKISCLMGRHHLKGGPGIFLSCALYAGRTWKRHIVVADIEELEKMDASELHTRRLNAKEVLTPQRSGNFIPSCRWISQNL